ncbi:hypothetical protein LMH87_001553 [Akanthomyces muscarius]|uniref:Uncharacterized protein n=1 Tax=Akanthomyces muscarius TaxID=2231603 RepID=A0A9W8Q4I7_AKAMU|nr:hypothetical protein LMH87_001553 [Akanthomyces muscarius]KAJ4147000.1 hypothetical protein LMH87_001553 [Akanthomyces muscarius]
MPVTSSTEEHPATSASDDNGGDPAITHQQFYDTAKEHVQGKQLKSLTGYTSERLRTVARVIRGMACSAQCARPNTFFLHESSNKKSWSSPVRGQGLLLPETLEVETVEVRLEEVLAEVVLEALAAEAEEAQLGGGTGGSASFGGSSGNASASTLSISNPTLNLNLLNNLHPTINLR